MSARPTVETAPRSAQTPMEAIPAYVGLDIHWVVITKIALVRLK